MTAGLRPLRGAGSIRPRLHKSALHRRPVLARSGSLSTSRRGTEKPSEHASADQRPRSQPVPDPFWNVRSHGDERNRAPFWTVFEVFECTAVPGDRNHRLISQRGQARKCRSRPCGEALDEERAAASLKRDPCVTRAVATSTATDESCRIPEKHQCPPGPEGEIVAVALPTAFELLRRHPVILATKLFQIADVSATHQELTYFTQIAAEHAQGLCDMPPHREIRRELAVATLAGSEDGTAGGVVSVREHFCDHRRPCLQPDAAACNTVAQITRSFAKQKLMVLSSRINAWRSPPIQVRGRGKLPARRSFTD